MDGSPSKGRAAKASLLSEDAAQEPLFKSTLEDERKQEIEATVLALRKDLEEHRQRRDKLLAENSRMTAERARQLTDEHIDRLHRYNDIKDAGQILFGKLAELKGKTVKDVYEEYSVDLGD
ncbi:Swi5-domain-containing protein [Martensiomyces pterosporus]|nr:Swi5-domain-containing protein [Martensiomyces pterosporus]